MPITRKEFDERVSELGKGLLKFLAANAGKAFTLGEITEAVAPTTKGCPRMGKETVGSSLHEMTLLNLVDAREIDGVRYYAARQQTTGGRST